MKRNKALKEMAAAFKESMGVDPDAPTGGNLKKAMEAVLSELEAAGMTPPMVRVKVNPFWNPGIVVGMEYRWQSVWEEEED